MILPSEEDGLEEKSLFLRNGVLILLVMMLESAISKVNFRLTSLGKNLFKLYQTWRVQ
jgi:hypothetical protein